MEIAQRLSSYTPESVAYIKRLVRDATETPLHRDCIERNLFLKLCISEPHSRHACYEEEHITSPSRSIVFKKERES